MPSSSAVRGGIGCDNSGTGCEFDSGTAINADRDTLTHESRGMRPEI